MDQTVNTAWYWKKCGTGVLVFFGTELMLLMLAALLLRNGIVGEGKMNALVLAAAALASFAGCAAAGRKSSRRRTLIPICAAASWLIAQVVGTVFCDGSAAAQSLRLGAAVAVGMLGALMLRSGKKKRRSTKRARR